MSNTTIVAENWPSAVAYGSTRHSTRNSSNTSHVLGEALFKGTLVRERKRASRSNEPLALLLVTCASEGREAPSLTRSIVEGVSAAKRETDVLGWLRQGVTLGVIIPEIAPCEASVLRSIEARFRNELSRRLPAAAAATLSVELRVQTPVSGADDKEFAPVDPLIPGQPRPLAGLVMKRALDIAGSLALFVAVSPLFLVIAALVKLGSKGPVFFRQVRVGEMERPFTMLKFRTMYTGVDHKLHHDFVTTFIKSSGQINEPAKDARFKIAHDPRITPVGRFLRRTSLDELPQFINVLRGDMSLVGPRPPLQYEVDQYQEWHCRRVREAKPGITGLWQVTGRSRTTFDEMVRLDLRYVKAASVWTDIKILLATPAAIISGKGAC
jgi:lipopolysaccharide/colanic/teichoic acid biosynthesis glycosyltransferase